MSKIIDQKKYLKKYLSSDDKLQKKKKKKSKDKGAEKVIKSTVKIIDDDAYTHFDHEIDESELYALNEEAPQIVGVIDERAADVIMKQEYIESGKWKAMKADKSEKKHKKNKSPRRTRNIPEQSPSSPRRRKENSDESPPRRSRKDSDASPPRKSRQLSPQIKKRRSSDESPPRRKRKDSDASLPRRSRPENISQIKRETYSDESPPRRKRRDSNTSPSRKSSYKSSRWTDEIKQEKSLPPAQDKKITKTLDGKLAGLQDARTLKRENEEYRARQEKAFREMKADVSGRDADVVIRDRRGRNKEFEYDAEKERKKLEKEESRKKEYEKWNKGLKQFEEIQQKRAEYEHEASKPLARSANDEDLQKHLKDQEWADDPMLQYMRRKKTEEKKSKGVLEKPIYRGNFPDNRFNIRPGYRWDGVDRSNGYEKKYFNMINSKKSIEEEAYRYSTEDM